ncbi:MAG: hypothetical protein LBI68_10030 [Azoarcus sp.]|jgi:hypothetical protein|nr:hypothetical protein [Azoarcus sp.]
MMNPDCIKTIIVGGLSCETLEVDPAALPDDNKNLVLSDTWVPRQKIQTLGV